jgi:hypothetical protein
MNAYCTQDEEAHMFIDAMDKLQCMMAKLSSDPSQKFSGSYNTVAISGSGGNTLIEIN